VGQQYLKKPLLYTEDCDGG